MYFIYVTTMNQVLNSYNESTVSIIVSYELMFWSGGDEKSIIILSF